MRKGSRRHDGNIVPETLEDRRLFSMVSLSEGLLEVQGNLDSTNHVEVVGSARKLLEVNLNGDKFYYRQSDVTQIQVTGGNKIDRIRIGRQKIPTSVTGGGGKDKIRAGRGVRVTSAIFSGAPSGTKSPPNVSVPAQITTPDVILSGGSLTVRGVISQHNDISVRRGMDRSRIVVIADSTRVSLPISAISEITIIGGDQGNQIAIGKAIRKTAFVQGGGEHNSFYLGKGVTTVVSNGKDDIYGLTVRDRVIPPFVASPRNPDVPADPTTPTTPTDPTTPTPPADPTTPTTPANPSVLVPGAGFSGPMPQPSQVGSGAASNENAIARWDVVPYQTFTGQFNVGVVAFHTNGINRVSFSVNGGPWSDTTAMTTNAQTGVVEYFATIQASDFSDGPVTVRAVAYPVAGVPRVLPDLNLNANANGTLPAAVRYVSPSGSDTAGDGSQGNPFATIQTAAHAISVAGGGKADGGTVYLEPGNYIWADQDASVGLSNAYNSPTSAAWLTIAPAPGVAKSDVVIRGRGISGKLTTGQIHVMGLTVDCTGGNGVYPFLGTYNSKNDPNSMIWIDGCRLIGSGATITGDWVNNFGDNQWMTDSTIEKSMNGTMGGWQLARNVSVTELGSDAFSGTLCVINCMANYNSPHTQFHPDVWQLYNQSGNNNMIAYGLTANIGYGQGIFAGVARLVTDVAIDNVNINNQGYGQLIPGVGGCLEFGAPVTNLYVLNSTFNGPVMFRTDLGFTAKDVVIESSTLGMPGSKPITVPSGVTIE